MDFGTWESDDGPCTSSINCKTLKSHYGFYDLGDETDPGVGFRMEIDGYDDDEAIFPCPYCSEDFADAELVEYHICEAHPSKANFDSESCPVCEVRVATDMIGHLISKHGDTFDIEQLLKLKKADSFEKEFHYGSSRTSCGESFPGAVSSNGALDELLSFICEVPPKEEVHNLQSSSSDAFSSVNELPGNKQAERVVQPSPISEEKAEEDRETRSRCDFVQGLAFSAFFDVDL